MNIAVKCKNVNKTYGNLNALKNIDLSLEENKIYGLLGRNGAGKTTLLNLICNQISRDSGDVEIFNEEVFENSEALEKICLIKDSGIPVPGYKVKDIFKIAGMLYKNWDQEYKDYLIKEFKIDINRKYKNLSMGTKSIVSLIVGLASRAEVTIFDEPTAGLDAAAREKFYENLLKDYEENQRTIILSTHLIDEVSSVLEEIVILNKGEIIFNGMLSSLLQKAKFLSGREENIMPLINNKKVIHKEVFGATSIIGALGEFTEEEIMKLRAKNVDISPIPLQKLFIYITEELNS